MNVLRLIGLVSILALSSRASLADDADAAAPVVRRHGALPVVAGVGVLLFTRRRRTPVEIGRASAALRGQR